jgi:hypothetical protein
LFTDIGLMDEPQAGLELVDRRRFDVAWPLARLAGKAASATKGRSNRENRSARNPMQRRCVDRPASPSDPLRQFRDQYPRELHGQARTVDHPQNRRAQQSPRARARAKIYAPTQAVGVKTGFPRGRQARGRSQERPLAAHAPARGPATGGRTAPMLFSGRLKRRCSGRNTVTEAALRPS